MMFAYEEDLKNVIYEFSKEIHLKGFAKMYENCITEVTMPSGKKIDLFTYEIYNNCLSCKILELKRWHVGLDTLFQALKYWSEMNVLSNANFSDYTIEVILVGNQVSPSLLRLCEFLPFVWKKMRRNK